MRSRLGIAGAFGAGILFSLVTFHTGTTDAATWQDCAADASRIRTTLYFGLGKPNGTVSELEWQEFLRDQVTPRFPQGLTVWEAQGQWQSKSGIGHERSKVLLLVHPDSTIAGQAIHAVIASYRKTFEQESVLWESAKVCAAM
jgi:hypothetical protein